MRIPVIISFGRTLKLRHAFCKPGRYGQPGNGIRDQHIGKTPHYIGAAFFFISEHLQPARRNVSAELKRFLQRDDMSVFVGDHIPKPIVGAAQNIIQIFRPDFYLVIKKVGAAIGIIFGIPNNKLCFGGGFVLIESGDMWINFFRNFCHHIGGPFRPLVIMHQKMLGFDGLPFQFGVVVVFDILSR